MSIVCFSRKWRTISSFNLLYFKCKVLFKYYKNDNILVYLLAVSLICCSCSKHWTSILWSHFWLVAWSAHFSQSHSHTLVLGCRIYLTHVCHGMQKLCYFPHHLKLECINVFTALESVISRTLHSFRLFVPAWLVFHALDQHVIYCSHTKNKYKVAPSIRKAVRVGSCHQEISSFRWHCCLHNHICCSVTRVVTTL